MRKTWICKRNGRKQLFVSAFSPFPWLIRSCAQEHCGSSLPPAVSPSLPGMSDSASPRMEGEPPQVRSGTGRKRSHAVRRAPALGAVTFLALQDGGVSHFFCYLCNPNNYINHLFRKKMKPTLLLLAAGMGSRYGGLKQLDELGPNGETIMDYSIYDAIQAGFGKIVFVIRKDFEEQFRRQVLSKYEGHIPAELVFQSIDALPEGFSVPEGREKPWGTNHAVLMAKDVVKEPFCVINCDDFYNRDCFKVIGKFLADLPEGARNRYAMVGFRVGNTLSENGTVARGICSTNAEGNLTTVVERTEIERREGEIKYKDEKGDWIAVGENTPVSMNVWGFTPDYFEYSEAYFREFLSDPKNMENKKSEYFIPLMVNKLINDGTATVKVLDTTSKWFGVTYAADRQSVVDKIQALVDGGVYPTKLF